jgi:hypothetical protein
MHDILIFRLLHSYNIKSYDSPEANCFLNSLKKIERGLTALALAPLAGLEKKERNRRLEERLKRSEQKHGHN